MEPTIYKPSIYKGAGIYKTEAEGGGGDENPILFCSMGTKESDNKDYPIIGGLSTKTYDSTFSKSVESGMVLFTNKTSNVNWEGGVNVGKALNDGKTFVLEMSFKNTKFNTDSSLASFFNVGGRQISVGFDTNVYNLTIGASSTDSSSFNRVFLKSGWRWETSFSYDLYVTNDNLIRDQIYKVKCKLKKNGSRVVLTAFVDEDKVMELDYIPLGFDSYFGTLYNNNKTLVFGDILAYNE